MIVTVANQKGGCGKTTTAVNLAAGLARNGYKTLLLDLDPQHHTSVHLGLLQPQYSILNFFGSILKNSDFAPESMVTKRNDTFYIIASEMTLTALEQELSSSNYQFDLINRLADRMNNMNFDFIIIDCPPNLGFLTLSALHPANAVIVPLELSLFSVKGADNLAAIIDLFSDKNRSVASVFYLVNMFDRRSRFSKSFFDKIQKQFNRSLLSTIIRNNVHLKEAANSGKTIFEHAPKSRGAEDFANLASEFVEKTGEFKPIEFHVSAPEAQRVYIVGDFTEWKPKPEFVMVKTNGKWTKRVNLKKGKYRYKFLMDNQWTHDKDNPQLESDSFGGCNSMLTIAD